MSKAQSILLFAIVGFYALLFVILLARACAAYRRASRPAMTMIERDSRALTRRRHGRSWTHAVGHEKLA
jgi:hypothetical protein